MVVLRDPAGGGASKAKGDEDISGFVNKQLQLTNNTNLKFPLYNSWPRNLSDRAIMNDYTI